MTADDVASASGLTLRAMTAADEPFVRVLFHDDRRAGFAALALDPLMLTALLDKQFNAQQAGYRQAFPNADRNIIEQHGDAVGRLIAGFSTSGEHRTYHLVDIVLSASARGRGIGTHVMRRLSETALTGCATCLSLSVLNANVGARRLYERLGFVAMSDDGVRLAMIKPLG